MAIKVPVGETDFRTIRNEGWYYVDKTRLLSDMLDSADKVIVITRPRRFGKSLMLSTLAEFLDIQNDMEETRGLFAGLRIMEREDLVEKHMGQHPVLHFSFNGVNGESFEQLMDNILARMKDWCINNEKSFDLDKCNKNDAAAFQRLQMGKACPDYQKQEIGEELLRSDLECFLTAMIRLLNATYGRKAVVLLDALCKALHNSSYVK